MSAGDAALLIGGAVVLGALVPWAFVRMLVPTLEASERAQTTNFRGRTVFYGLGIVWLVWAGCAIVGGVASNFPGQIGGPRSVLPALTLAGPLALVAFALGLVDDAYGGAQDRGFRGHFRALAHGRLSTGMLKLIGISLASLVVALVLSQAWTHDGQVRDAGIVRAVLAMVGGAAIALTSNFVNLVDLRPGRALKVYIALALAGTASAVRLASVLGPAGARPPASTLAVEGVALALFLLGPVVATWRYDLAERGMIGDAGANAMGAVAGLVIVAGLPAWGLAAFAAVMLALNLVSERVSFSEVIERNGALRWLDSLGRSADGAPAAEGSEIGPADVTSER